MRGRMETGLPVKARTSNADETTNRTGSANGPLNDQFHPIAIPIMNGVQNLTAGRLVNPPIASPIPLSS